MTVPLPLTVVIPTLNEEGQIGEALEALRWASEVIVADGGSSDRTAAIAGELGARVIDVTGRSIAAQRNAGVALARNAWVLALDADERVTEALRGELAAVLARPAHDAYRVRCRSFFLGRERKHGRWARDWHVRLFTRDRRFTEDRVHERLEPVRDVGTLHGCLHHVPYRDLTHHLEKMVVYARWGAETLYARGRRATAWEILAHPLWRFARDYLVYAGCLDGCFGLLTSMLTAFSGFLKYAYLWELHYARPASAGRVRESWSAAR